MMKHIGVVLTGALILGSGCFNAKTGSRRSLVYASWNIGHYAYGRDFKTRVNPEEAVGRKRAYRDFLESVGADVLGVCEYYDAFTTDQKIEARSAVFGNYRQAEIGPQEAWQWNALFFNGLTVLERKVRYYPKHVQNVYYLAVKVLLSDGEPAWFVQTHLDWGTCFKGHADDRADQMRVLIEDFKEERRVVIAGDFNIGDRGRDDVRRENTISTPEEFDVFAQAGYQLGNVANAPTCPTDNPTLPLDNIMAKGLKIVDFNIRPVGDLSDHNAISCRIVW